jgi:hypothetical protein
MDVHANSSGLQHVVGYGPHSVVLAYPNHHHHNTNNHRHHFHSLPPPPRSLPKATTSYELVPLVPVVPTTIYMPVEQKKQQQQQQSQGNHHRTLYSFFQILFLFF